MAEERSAVLKADRAAYDQDEVWAAAAEARPGGGQQGAGCNRRALQGTRHPQTLCPQLALSWRGRGENVINERRAELRKGAYTSIAAIEKEAIAAQTRKIVELEAKVVMTGMASDEAKSMLADIMNLDVLRPKIEASEIAKMLESRNRMNLYYTHRDYSPPPVDDC
jgi:hypothetical protein